MSEIDTEVAIIGGGPAGLMLAIELGCRDIPCVVLEEDVAPPDFPKANATSSRTMEHYRRRGFAHLVRDLGLPADYPADVTYYTRLARHELFRFSMHSRADAAGWSKAGDSADPAWPTPELPHRAQQMYIEPILRDQARRWASVDLRLGRRAVAVTDNGPDATVDHTDPDGNDRQKLRARYVVGCDGPRSLVRDAMGVKYSGEGTEVRDFMGGQMLSIYFRSSDLYQVLGGRQSWQYWAINPTQRGLLTAIDGGETFLLIIQLAPGQSAADIDCRAVTAEVVGAPHDFDLVAALPWNAGYMLVADRFSKGRLFIAGDAAHLFTPTGGMGYNTSVDDVVNLGWKLALVIGGHAPAALLDSYESERRPIAFRNTAFARRMADSIGRIAIPRLIEDEGAAGDASRAEAGAQLARHAVSEFRIPGLQLGLRYEGSPIVAQEAGDWPPDDPNEYVPSARPGSRAPHLVVEGKPLFDRFHRDFTLLTTEPVDVEAWQAAAAERGLQLGILTLGQREVRDLYAAPSVLVRPDHHVAWRGAVDAVPGPVLDLARGAAMTAELK